MRDDWIDHCSFYWKRAPALRFAIQFFNSLFFYLYYIIFDTFRKNSGTAKFYHLLYNSRSLLFVFLSNPSIVERKRCSQRIRLEVSFYTTKILDPRIDHSDYSARWKSNKDGLFLDLRSFLFFFKATLSRILRTFGFCWKILRFRDTVYLW